MMITSKRQSSFKYCSSNAVLLICPLPPYVRFWCYASPCCKSSIRTFSRHPNCRNCGWRLSIDHRVTPGPGALSRLYPALARANPWCSKRANHTTGDRSAHATSHSFPNLQLLLSHSYCYNQLRSENPLVLLPPSSCLTVV